MKKVLVLMSTYNGQMYLKEQLVSIYAQKGVDCTLLVRDDGSRIAQNRSWLKRKRTVTYDGMKGEM